MKLFYLANIRIPTEKAHGVAIVKACEAFAKAGAETTLVVPRRRTPIKKTVFEAYSVEQAFSVVFLPTLDLIREKGGAIFFRIQTLTFQLSLICFLLFSDRKTILYTRDSDLLSLCSLGYKVVFECHLIHGNRKVFFTLARRAHRIVVISQALKNAFIEAGFSPESVLVAPSGVDLSIFDIDISKEEARRQLDLPHQGFIGVYTGNFTTMGEDKGISDIVKALPHSPQVTFVAVGGSEKDMARYLKQAEELRVSDRVIFRGSTTQQNLALYQKAADVLLMPFPDTPHYRNHMSPVKMFEYMVSRRPIIASDLPTIREVLNSENAVIVPAGNPVSLASTLGEIRLHPAHSNTLAERAFKDAQVYSWTSRAERVLAFVESGHASQQSK
jgi:glycosyltransferase involved in cell wall biosynthesis